MRSSLPHWWICFGDELLLPACCRKDKQNQALQQFWYFLDYVNYSHFLYMHATSILAAVSLLNIRYKMHFEKTKACIRYWVLYTHQEIFLAFWGIFRIPFLFLRPLLKSSIWVAGTSICSSKDSSGSSSAPNSKLINQNVI